MKKDNLTQLAFRLKLRNTLKKEPIELVRITHEEAENCNNMEAIIVGIIFIIFGVIIKKINKKGK